MAPLPYGGVVPSVPLPTGRKVEAPCPHCAVPAFYLAVVSPDAAPRNYIDSPATVAALLRIEQRGGVAVRTPAPPAAGVAGALLRDGAVATVVSLEGGFATAADRGAMEPVAEEDATMASPGNSPASATPPPSGVRALYSPAAGAYATPADAAVAAASAAHSPLLPRVLAPLLAATATPAPSTPPRAALRAAPEATPVASLFADAAAGVPSPAAAASRQSLAAASVSVAAASVTPELLSDDAAVADAAVARTAAVTTVAAAALRPPQPLSPDLPIVRADSFPAAPIDDAVAGAALPGAVPLDDVTAAGAHSSGGDAATPLPPAPRRLPLQPGAPHSAAAAAAASDLIVTVDTLASAVATLPGGATVAAPRPAPPLTSVASVVTVVPPP